MLRTQRNRFLHPLPQFSHCHYDCSRPASARDPQGRPGKHRGADFQVSERASFAAPWGGGLGLGIGLGS
eukprot:2754507-Pyramimonas_sp.AAC.1